MNNIIKNKKNLVKYLINIFIVISISMMVILVFVNAVFRYAFNSGMPASEELARFFFIWTCFLGMIIAFKDGGHVAVTVFTDGLKGKMKKVVAVIASFCSLFAMGIVLYGGIVYTKMSSTYNSVATNINFAVITISIVVMSVSIIMMMIMNLIKSATAKNE